LFSASWLPIRQSLRLAGETTLKNQPFVSTWPKLDLAEARPGRSSTWPKLDLAEARASRISGS
jgi:hypothetical protein